MTVLVKWFIDNPIAANLLMIAMLAGGVAGYKSIKKEAFPRYEGNIITVSMAYPGAASSEVEQQIVVRIEEAIADLPGIFQISSMSRQGVGVVTIAVTEGFDVRELLNDVKGRVDAINTFPVSAERPVIQQQIRRPTLMWFAIYGDADRRVFKDLAYQIRDEMTLLEGVSEVRIMGLKEDEVSIEVSEENLRRYNLSFNEIANAIRQSSVNIPAGTIKSKHGDIQIQTRAQAFNYNDFADIVVRSDRDRGQLFLSDVAVINDGFSEQNVDFYMNGKPGLNMEVKMSDDPLLFEGTANARKYLEDFRKRLPDGIELKINFEAKTTLFDSRFNLLKDNALFGLLLVFLVLMLFLRPLLAFWVVAGIATTFAGAIWLLPYFDVSINMISMFAFILVLGIVVDDAIIIGESIYRHQQHGEIGRAASNSGAASVIKPVFLAVASTVIFFLPMIHVPSTYLVFTRSLFYVVFLCLTLSFVESLYILPSHLSHMRPERPARLFPFRILEKIRNWSSVHMERFVTGIYIPALRKSLQHKASTYLLFLFIFAAVVTLTIVGWIPTNPQPNIPQSFVYLTVNLPEGSSFQQTRDITQYIVDQVDVLSKDEELLKKNNGKPYLREVNRSLNGTSANLFIGFTWDEERDVSSVELVNRLRELIGPLPEAQSFSLNASQGSGAPDISLNMNMLDNSREVQQAAVKDVSQILAAYPGVFNVRNDLDSERTEVEVKLKPYAETLGITVGDVARQVRQGFYGEEIQRIPRTKEDVRVMLRYLAEERQTLDTLNHIRIRTADGREVPIDAVAEIKLVPGPSTIRRVDRKRNITITAEVAEDSDADSIVTEMMDNYLPQWEGNYPGFSLSRDGNLKEQAKFYDNFSKDFFKVFIIVMALFAIAFRSLFQPFLIMLAVPFGFVGAVLGHLCLGYNFSMFSYFGLLACSGVVVNDNLVLITRINQLRKRGSDTMQAIIQAGIDRFRPIVLTSLTTFIGLLPILFERSMQAQFLKPMVVALAFGVMFSSVVTLFLVPCGYHSGYLAKLRIISVFKHIYNKFTGNRASDYKELQTAELAQERPELR